MPTLKILGAVLVLCVTALSAYRTTRLERARLATLDAWLSLLYFVRGQIDCFARPLDEILLYADKSVLEALGCCTAVPHLSTLLESSRERLDSETLHILKDLLGELGSTYREEQVRRCDYYLKLLQAQRERISAQLPARIKLCVTLHLCLALGAAVVLW